MQEINLEVKDWMDMEEAAIEQIRNGKKMILIGTEILTAATININKLGGETTSERIKRMKEEQAKQAKNNTNTEAKPNATKPK